MGSSAAHPVITGTGVITAYGAGVAALWAGLLAGRTALGPIRRFPTGDLSPATGGEVPGDAWGEDRVSAFLARAADEALGEAALARGDVPAERIGVAVGTTLAGMTLFERWLGGAALPAPDAIPYFAPALAVARHAGAAGPVVTTQLACASGTAAVGLAARWIREGRCDVVLAGGADLLCRFVVAGFNCLRATAEVARPFDARREGLVLGEGGAVLVVEAAGHAARRGAAVRARITGFAMAGDAVHMTAPDREGRGAAAAIAQALGRAGVSPAAVDFVSAHGTGTPYNDAMEARALGAVFGRPGPPVQSVKGAIGHTLGAAGAIEAALVVEVLARQVIPPTLGLETLAPECDGLDVVADRPRAAPVGTCVSTSSGFAGANAALVLERP